MQSVFSLLSGMRISNIIWTSVQKVKLNSYSHAKRYDLDKPENIIDLYRQSNLATWKNSIIRSYQKPLEPGLKLKIQLVAEFCPPGMT